MSKKSEIAKSLFIKIEKIVIYIKVDYIEVVYSDRFKMWYG